MRNRKHKKRRGAAMTEAMMVIPVLLTLVCGVFYAWRLFVITSAAQTAVRSEMMLHSLAVNASDILNRESWRYAQVGFSRNSEFYCNTLRVFPGVSADAVTISAGPDTISRSTHNVYDAMRAIMTDAARSVVEVELPAQPFLHRREERPVYRATGICAVNPWALDERQFFGALTPWIDNMRAHGMSQNFRDEPTILRSVTPPEGLPSK